MLLQVSLAVEQLAQFLSHAQLMLTVLLRLDQLDKRLHRLHVEELGPEVAEAEHLRLSLLNEGVGMARLRVPLLFDYAHAVEALENIVLLVRDAVDLTEVELERDELALLDHLFVDHHHEAATVWDFLKLAALRK